MGVWLVCRTPVAEGDWRIFSSSSGVSCELQEGFFGRNFDGNENGLVLYLRLALIKVLVSILSTRLSTGLGFLGCVRGAWQGMYTKWYRIVI